MPRIAVIGGTGVYDPALLDEVKKVTEKTRFGEVAVMVGKYRGEEIAFIPRHGADHSVAPHLINYRANIMALKQLGVDCIMATAAVGSLLLDYKPGEFVLADQFLDFTKVRKHTFYEGGADGVVHCDMTVPYCPELRQAIIKAGQEKGLTIHNGGTYVCTEGPRFETGAEIKMFQQLGGHVIGMTSVPEVCLARELGICYANLSFVTNYAAGISPGILTHAEVVEMMQGSINNIRYLIMESVGLIKEARSCDCRRILQEKRMNQ
ncbi:Methylthioadenosine phosphorylase (MTAP) [Syntrophomonas zehnderi OL-4]|uniref:Probable 6-oxopurine nucleoside phosphorylase n=1 Tax=Syntrophomonas zehnderi OL-4 TaxID=690567 RepID=A0A0E4C9M3_9FIRM|nr:S-methyl-5'-thioadenosine phosphorylase [Syntrophomonas zehnderi]CFY05690.1 Methylthioadenosine phosphorylase (MTAP) [Syntrophomonas zehnderi OL-4]